MNFKYDVIVVGAGHAGCEAATAAARMGSKTLLVTMDMNTIAQLSCNPAMGGIAKGQIVREIDALGGMSGIVSDKTSIQFRMLNQSKGPAMWSPRTQNDRTKFISTWRKIVENTDNLFIWQDQVVNLLIKNNEIKGVKTALGAEFEAAAVVLTNGTFLGGLIHIGKFQTAGGRAAEPASYGLTEQLKSLGFETDRMKTGTPARIDGRTVDFSLMTEQPGEETFHKYSYLDYKPRELKQVSCWLTKTNEEVHKVLVSRIEDSPMFNGQITSLGPRYCPSVETKVITFAEKNSHNIFLEPEGVDTNEYYINGFSSSLPWDIQIEALKKIPAFRNVHIFRPGYAIEYDFFPPTQLKHTLETKKIEGLYFAGQINGTTGYEEAAGQGLIAGINAHLKINKSNEFILKRNEAYIGVLIDDLVTKGVDEPYRMFTSRAEYRILLRQDNADERLTKLAYKIGIAERERIDLLEQKQNEVDRIIKFTNTYSLKPAYINEGLEKLGTTPLKQGLKLKEIITRPQLDLYKIAELVPAFKEELNKIQSRKEEIIETVEIKIKYEGYIEREKIIAHKIERLENLKIKGKFDYNSIQSLSTEARQKLSKIDPDTIAQASRIPGISPNDISILLILLGR